MTIPPTGSAYDMKPPQHRSELTEVGRGTPMGELLRRYWHPVGVSSELLDKPIEVRVLGEDLVLFRDLRGNPGLVHARCCHRGSSLYFGKIEECGIRCCYHGWLFDVEGRCLEQPVEPDMGAKSRDRVRQPWYPVEERYGLVFAYMGPLDRKPVLPRWECLEQLGEGEFLDVDATSIGSGGDTIAPCNWLQHYENVVDPYHVAVLHGSFSGTQFTNVMTALPDQLDIDPTPRGVRVRSVRRLPDGRTMNRITEAVLPTVRAVPNPFHGRLDLPVESLGWTVPIDDHHYRIYTAGRVTKKGAFLVNADGEVRPGRNWRDMTPEERRDYPGDWEAQVSQGPITIHSEEHLTSSDRGIVQLRKQLYKQLDVMKAGGDPVGVQFDPDAPPIKLEAGNWISAGE